MPEGDTVFLTGKRLTEALSGRPLTRAEIRHPRLSTVELSGRTVREVHTVGKHLFVRFDNELSLHHHLKMDGSWYVQGPADKRRGRDHDIRVILATSERMAIGYRLHDLALLPTKSESELVGHLGPDLLGADWDDAALAEAVRRLAAQPDQEIGLALQDQRVMAGVGNLYRVEVCFLLGVSPWTRVSTVDSARAVALCRKLLLRNAWRPEQSTTGETARGRQHFVYQRTGKGCLRCGTAIRVAMQGSDVRERGTWFCPKCQPGPHP